MDDPYFRRIMHSIGLTCFVRNFELLTDTKLSPGDAVAELNAREPHLKVKVCQSRVSHARRIIKEARVAEGLHMFLSSKAADYDLEQKARRHLAELAQQAKRVAPQPVS